jgi:2-dehydro-3-deoxyphosphooctonate aldolase (KDO 8-P synthase)
MSDVQIAPGVAAGPGYPLLLIAGPCLVEDADLMVDVATTVREIAAAHGVGFVFKSSFDKANRSSGSSARGPGIDAGLEILARVKAQVGVPVLTDIHEPWQALPAAEVCAVLQIPAFLCRQTDLLVAAARSGAVVNVKKGQFLAPADMTNVVAKLRAAGAAGILLTERGTTFGYGNLVVDFRALPQLRALGEPVVFDATHSIQLPGGLGTSSGGQREFVPHLARAAAAVGIDALFLEVHPSPADAPSDGPNMVTPAELDAVLTEVLAVRGALTG